MKNSVFWQGFRDGIPIGTGYFAVAFSLGISARNAGLSAMQGFWASFLNVASAGEYALFSAIKSEASLFALVLIIFVVNARYLLMSCALSQRFDEKTPFFHRFFVGFGITDEIFGISINQKGSLNPLYNYGAIAVSVPLWSIGTVFGIVLGNILPSNVVSALSVALYGMFIAIIVPPAKKNFVIAMSVAASFLLSYGFSVLPKLKDISGTTRTIILTVAISAVVAVLKPVRDENNE